MPTIVMCPFTRGNAQWKPTNWPKDESKQYNCYYRANANKIFRSRNCLPHAMWTFEPCGVSSNEKLVLMSKVAKIDQLDTSKAAIACVRYLPS